VRSARFEGDDLLVVARGWGFGREVVQRVRAAMAADEVIVVVNDDEDRAVGWALAPLPVAGQRLEQLIEGDS
jgi:hypothetical protein